YPKADLIIPNAIGTEQDLINAFNIDKNKIQVIHNLLDIKKIFELQKEPVEMDESIFTFVTVGRFFDQKNHLLLIKTMKDINAKLIIIGDGVLRDELENTIVEYKLENKVFLLGQQANPYKYLSKADCFVLSSDYEGFPNVLLEALACKLPIISTDCQSGPREILAPGSDVNFQLKDDIEIGEYGILTAVGNSESLLKAMKRIFTDSVLRKTLIKKADTRASAFDKNIIIEEWIGLLKIK
ncbi:glycosyltransferase, partial [Sulfurimonas sp. MAG313]